MHSHTWLHSTAYICSTSRHTDKRLRPQTAKCSRKVPLKSSASWKQTAKLPKVTSVSSPQDDSAANSVRREQPVLHLNENAISESSHDVNTTGKYPMIVLRRTYKQPRNSTLFNSNRLNGQGRSSKNSPRPLTVDVNGFNKRAFIMSS